jgi:type II secretory pathway component PulM
MIPSSWRVGRIGQALAVGCGVLALVLIWLGAIAPLWAFYADGQAELEQRQALLARMQGLAASLPAVRGAAASRHGEGAEEAGAMLPGATDALAAAALQESVQRMARDTGASLTAVETLPAAAAAEHWHKVSLRISLNAPWPVLIGLMHAVEKAPARIFIGDVHFHSPAVAAHPASLPIQASMVLYGFRTAEPGAGT